MVLSGQRFATYRRDVQRHLRDRRLSPYTQLLWRLATQPSLQAVTIFRAQAALEATPFRRIAYLLYRLNQLLTGAELCVGCRIGPGVDITHPSGVVIGAQVIIGEDCTMESRVTIGARALPGRDASSPLPMPRVGNGVFLGSGAVVIGDITIGDGARVGANAVVLTDVGPGLTAVGVPARVVQEG